MNERPLRERERERERERHGGYWRANKKKNTEVGKYVI